MKKINEILTINFQEDIKSVIDLEDRSETEIQTEIESYIVTEGIGEHLYNFTNQFTSNIKETGVWLSGFYGSGKSYFGKIIGYIIGNPMINGTSARDRFIPRLKGIKDESLIENSIRNLDSINCRVVFLDIAKQNTDNGLAFTLFANLLKNLGFRDDIYGYMEYDLFVDGKLDEFKIKTKSLEGQEWDQLKTSNRTVAKVMRKVFIEMGYSEIEYEETRKVYENAIKDFSASKFKNVLERYLNFQQDETLVFIFDEASEAISQRKFTLLDLEGISEMLSSIEKKVWTIAIAQEKLDDVINSANVSKNQLTKVTDRFKTKIHLEATEVDVIIRHRLLQKTEIGEQQLLEYYSNNEGLISDATNLKSNFPTKTENAEEFSIYYPFHKYQFDILQKFLFSSNALVATQSAARGMIITTFDILKRQIRDESLFNFATGYSICNEAQTSPDSGLVNKYDSAKKILQSSPIDGGELLKTIHLLDNSAIIFPTVESITKSYISDINMYYETKPIIEEALTCLVDSKVLLLSNNNYKITSELETKLLEEMNGFDVPLHNKKQALINYLKKEKLFTSISSLNVSSDNFKFSINSDQDDELVSVNNKDLKLKVYSLYNINEDRQDFIENIKMDTQYQKDCITLIPENVEFKKIDKLIDEISKYTFIEDKYANDSDANIRKIIRDFSIIREEKEKDLLLKIEHAYNHATLVYMFDDYTLNETNFKSIVNENQNKMIKNIFTKKLSSGLAEALVPKIFKSQKEELSKLFSTNDFKFFDTHGNFIGENLKVVEEINNQIKSRYVDGRTLDTDFSGAPWGYSFGTIVSTLAVLFRSGRLSVKYNGETWLSHEHLAVHEAFTNATRFRSASFKSLTATLSSNQKNEIVQELLDLEIDTYLNEKIDWNTNDFQLAESIGKFADKFLGKISELENTVNEFGTLFPIVAQQRIVLQGFTGKMTENNYIDRAEYFLANRDEFSEAIKTIEKAQKFIKKNFSKVQAFKRFVEDVTNELKKANQSEVLIEDATEEFNRLYNQNMVKNFSSMQEQVQIVKDNYYKMMKKATTNMTFEYQMLNGKVDAALKKLESHPAELNHSNQKKLNELKRYCMERIINDPILNQTISCEKSGYSLSDILNYIQLVRLKEQDLFGIENSFVSEAPQREQEGEDEGQPVPKKPRKINFQIKNKVMTVQEYKALLTNQLAILGAARPEEEIELEIDTL
ncbi:BREX system P-loop protein BrxC [Metalysinibacillus jejuensis]|uniref:BREX system P-loop protein BrxC n=1 Tax=Metalysinibacillus jejuensis TaxID=914327 RepID=UPI000D33AB53|nr:BREX system P-loop protein BrxC [Metalysinibacillus jejuensis]